jgi:2-oxoglutarate dehydrogenase E2 component (dihydrolipoamide succinyltransferase)
MVEFRKKYADQFVKRHNLKLGFMSAFVKASACALLDNPVVNAGRDFSYYELFDDLFFFEVIDGNEIVYRDYVDISVAVASPKVIDYNEKKEIFSKEFCLGFSCTCPSKCRKNEFR